jgi:hypothetical protein
VADPSQVGMQNRLMVGDLVGAVTARCRTELDDLGLATDMARRPDLHDERMPHDPSYAARMNLARWVALANSVSP